MEKYAKLVDSIQFNSQKVCIMGQFVDHSNDFDIGACRVGLNIGGHFRDFFVQCPLSLIQYWAFVNNSPNISQIVSNYFHLLLFSFMFWSPPHWAPIVFSYFQNDTTFDVQYEFCSVCFRRGGNKHCQLSDVNVLSYFLAQHHPYL